MDIEEIDSARLSEYAQIPIAYEVRSILQVEVLDTGWGLGSGGIKLHEQMLEEPYIKDYDGYGEGRPLDWLNEFDVSRWGFLLVVEGGEAVGAAAIAYDTPGIFMLERRSDLALLWDIRVQPEARGRGVGRTLFEASTAWARKRGCRLMKIETQNVNVPACRFYAAMGCTLGAINCYAYSGHPQVGDEVMLLWYLDL
jgi:GNAT superfamily N-acetyltransferase